MDAQTGRRRLELDWLRVLAVAFVFLAHCGRFFDTATWHVKNSTTYPALDLWGAVMTTWLMPLLFLVSGASVFFALRKGPARFVRDRTLRLLVSLVAGIFCHIILCVVQWSIPDLLKFVVILVSSLAVTLVLYEFLIRRFNVLRVLFGLKPSPRKAPKPVEPQALPT